MPLTSSTDDPSGMRAVRGTLAPHSGHPPSVSANGETPSPSVQCQHILIRVFVSDSAGHYTSSKFLAHKLGLQGIVEQGLHHRLVQRHAEALVAAAR